MKFYIGRQGLARHLIVFAVAVQLTPALRSMAADSSDVTEDSLLQGELIEPIGKAPTNSVPVPTGKIQDGDVVGFDQLAGFKVALNNDLLLNTNRPAWADEQVNTMIPGRIRAADGKLVSVDGFMIPLEYNGKKVSKFILAMNQNTCCFGGNPQIHEFIIVSAPAGGANDEMDIPLRIKGVLHVGAFRSNGKLSGVYRLYAHNVTYSPTE
jgi:hypothetical protein